MTKRKIKFNILDVAIVLIALASCFLVFFSDAVSELFGDPEIEIVEMTVKISDSPCRWSSRAYSRMPHRKDVHL